LHRLHSFCSISSTIARVISPEALSAAPCSCIVRRTAVPAASMNRRRCEPHRLVRSVSVSGESSEFAESSQLQGKVFWLARVNEYVGPGEGVSNPLAQRPILLSLVTVDQSVCSIQEALLPG